MRRYYVRTLGCKLNQFDSAVAENLLRAADYCVTSDPGSADVILLNTCTVTGRADAEGRRLARTLRRLAPGARIVATGCYAERDAEALRRTGAFDRVVGLAERNQLPEALLGGAPPLAAPSTGALWAGRARALLRVQEGCDLACSYCVIPAVRGPGRSAPAAELRAAVRDLTAHGVREIGLTGVNTGSWGRDLTPRRELADLIEELLDETPAGAGSPSPRFRLNSLEPHTVTGRLLALVAAAPDRLARHIQMPLQSGSDPVLQRMSRNYTTSRYRDIVERAFAAAPDICIGADVIAGFPGESDAEHATTLALVSGLPLGYLHVFSYSARPGTRAAALRDPTPPPVVRARTTALRDAGTGLSRAFRERMLGGRQLALALDGVAPDGARRALTGNYIEVLLPPGAAAAGDMIPVRLARLEDDGDTVRAEPA